MPRATRRLGTVLAVLLLLVAGAALARPGAGQSFSGGSRSGGGGGGGGDGVGVLVQLLLWLCIDHPAIGIPCAVLVVIALLARSAIGRSMQGWSTTSPAQVAVVERVKHSAVVPRSEIDRIRGVDASGALKRLLEKKLVRIVGRKDVPGKPIIYGTTRKFLEIFNLKDLSELPTLRELRDLQGPQE